jgi:hypothetical protein
MWLLLGILGLLAEMTVIIVLGRRATADYEGQPLVAARPGGAPAVGQPAVPDLPPEPVTS